MSTRVYIYNRISLPSSKLIFNIEDLLQGNITEEREKLNNFVMFNAGWQVKSGLTDEHTLDNV